MRTPSALAAAFALSCACAAAQDVVHVERIEIRGNTVVPAAELDAIARPYAGRDVSVAELEELRQKLTRRYVDGGFVNSGALIPEGALAGGTLTVRIVEGRLAAVRLKGLERLRESYVVARLVPDPQAVLNVDALRDRFQLLLSDPLFDRVRAGIMPAPERGSAYLDVEVVRARPYQVTLFANNYRPPSIGEYAVGVSGWVRNLSGFGDLLDASLQAPTQGDHAPRGDIAWRIPLGPWQTEVSALWSRGRSSVVEEPSSVLDIESELTTGEIGIAQRLYEDMRQRAAMGVGASRRENVTTLGGEPFSFVLGEPDGVTRVRSLRFWQEYSYRWEGGAAVLRSTFARNRNNLEDVGGLPLAVSTFDHENRTWIGQAYLGARIPERSIQASIRATLQRTRERLIPLDALSLGGVNSVRGFRENQLLRDEGGFVNAEVEVPAFSLPERGLAVNVAGFADHGFGRNQGGPRLSLSSVGFVTRARWGGWRADLAVALHRWRSEAIARSSGALQDRGVHLQVSHAVF
jgi:hemolysin activation/secretion protein